MPKSHSIPSFHLKTAMICLFFSMFLASCGGGSDEAGLPSGGLSLDAKAGGQGQQANPMQTSEAQAGSAPPPASVASASPEGGTAPSPAASFSDPRFFTLVKGWADTNGGRGGQIVRVTNLASSGPGSLRAAIDMKGPRIIVFETSGNIDLNGGILHINEPYVTVAGQTAPSPGITLIKGGIQTHTHDVIVQHLKIRPGTGAGAVADALETQRGSYNVIVDHCSLSWGTDEVLSAAGYAFSGNNLSEWRAATSNRITFSNNIVAESLTSNGQGYGSLMEDNATQILLYGNYYVHNHERSPNFGGATQGAVINNLIYNPGQKFLDYTFAKWKWDSEGGGQTAVGKITAIGNVGRAGPSTSANAFFETVSNGDVEYFSLDNVATRLNGSSFPATIESTYLNNPQGHILARSTPPVSPPGVTPMPSTAVEKFIQETVGARPWDRDAHDRRVLDDHRNRTGGIIGTQSNVGGYPVNVVNLRPFDPALWDLDTMTPRSLNAL